MAQRRTRALITGASSGIGAEYARQLAAQGVNLILTARNETRLRGVAREVTDAYGVEAEIILADLAGRAGIDKLAARIKEATDLDVLINNAGFGAPVALAEADTEVQLAMMSVHMTATMLLTKAALPAMIERQRGQIINVTSTSAFIPVPIGLNYTATKSYVIGFSESLQQEVAEQGIQVQAVCVGYTHTGFHSSETWDMDMSWIPDEYWMEAEDVVRESLERVGKNGVIYVTGQINREAIAAVMRNLYFLPRWPNWFARLARWLRR